MAALVTWDTVKSHLKLSGDEEKDDLERKAIQATSMVIRLIERPDHEWTDDTDPDEDEEFALVQAAILDVIATAYANRGDGEVSSMRLSRDMQNTLIACGLMDPTVV